MSLTKFYERDGITIYCGDCLEIAPQLNVAVDAVISDPPYGMGWNTDSTRFTGGKHTRGDGRNDWGKIINDDVPFDPSPWLQYPKVILWGCNHFASKLSVGTTLIWIKKHESLFGTFLSDAEVAWMKGGHGVYCFYKQYPPPSRIAEGQGKVLHPNQKPIALMQWCVEKAKVNGVVLDPFMGSGTTLVAAQRLGRRAVGIEISEEYCKIAVERIRQRLLWQIPSPETEKPKPRQVELELDQC